MSEVSEKVLVLRTCDCNMQAHGGFVWPESGLVECPDWDPKPECGNGLHGLLWGNGDLSLMSADADAKYLLVEVDADVIVDLGGKVKFPRGNVVYCGHWLQAFATLREHWMKKIQESDQTTATTGTRAHAATTGYEAHAATTGDWAHAATTGENAIAVALGRDSTVRAGEKGALVATWWDEENERLRVAVAHVGEDGIKPNTTYRVESGRFIEVEPE